MSKFIETTSGNIINLDYVVSIDQFPGKVTPTWRATMKDGSQHQLWNYTVAGKNGNALTGTTVPASPEDKAIVGYYDGDGDPATFQTCKIVAWTIYDSDTAVPILDDWQAQNVSNSVLGVIQHDGAVTQFNGDGVQFESVEAFKAYVQSLCREAK